MHCNKDLCVLTFVSVVTLINSLLNGKFNESYGLLSYAASHIYAKRCRLA